MAYASKQSIREEAGLQSEVLKEVPSGAINGTNKKFTVSHTPIVDRDYSNALDVADVVAYVDGAVVTVSAINATTGEVTLESAPANGTTVEITYAYSNVKDGFVTDVQGEADDFINERMGNLVTVPFSPVPATIRKIARVYAAGLLLARDYGFNSDIEGTSKDGYKKIQMAAEWLALYYEDVRDKQTAAGEVSSSSDGYLLSRKRDSDGLRRPITTDEQFSFGSDTEPD